MRLIAGLLSICAFTFEAADNAFAEALQFDCLYTQTANGAAVQDSDFKLKFTLDTVTGEAFMVGNNGLNKVAVMGGSFGLSFVEYLPTGAVQTTTITKGGNSVHRSPQHDGRAHHPIPILRSLPN